MRIFWLDNMWKVSVQDSLYSWHNLWKHKHSRNPNIHFKNVANVSFVWISNALSSILPTIRKYFLFKILVYIYIWLCLVFAATCRLSPVAASRAPLWLRGADFSLRWLLWLQSRASRRASVIEAPSSAVVALAAHGVGDLPRPGNELLSPVLAGGFFTTEPPGKAQ